MKNNKLLLVTLLSAPTMAHAHGITEEFVYGVIGVLLIVPIISCLLALKGQRIKTLLIHFPLWVVWIALCIFSTGFIGLSLVSLFVAFFVFPVVSWSYLIYKRVNKDA